MFGRSSAIRTEVLGLELTLDEDSLSLLRSGENLIVPIALAPEDAERVRIEMAKAQLWEWNQLQELRSRAELRYRRYLGSWLTMCLAAFSAYLSYPSYYLCVALALLSVLLWWRAGFAERQAAEEAQEARKAFREDWEYLRERES